MPQPYLRLPILAAVAAVTLPSAAAAQCVGDLREEVLALDAVAEAYVAAVFPKSMPEKKTSIDLLRDAQGGDRLFLSGLAASGRAAPCLLEKKEIFRGAFAAAVRPEALDGKSADDQTAQVRRALREAGAAVLASRYTPSDRVGALFGFGFSFLSAGDRRRFKVVSRSTAAPAGSPAGTPATATNYVVEESNSTTLPAATTGIAARFRDRRGALYDHLRRRRGFARRMARTIDMIVPTTAFGAVQIGNTGAETGIVTGTALGVGWRLVGDVTLLLGASANRVPTLRDDLLDELDRTADRRLPLPTGESAETVRGTETANALLVGLAVPVGFKSVFGAK